MTGNDAQTGHARDLIGRRIAAMLDAVASVDPWRGAHGRLDRVERHADGAVTLGVDADLPAAAVRAHDQILSAARAASTSSR